VSAPKGAPGDAPASSGEEETSFQFLAENSADIICRVGPDAILRYVSPSSVRVLGWTPEELVGTGPELIVLAEDIPKIVANRERGVAGGGDGEPVTIRMRKKDGFLAWMEVSTRIVRDPSTGAHKETILVMRDITERKVLEERLLGLALTDSLTGLANRRAFDDALEREWLRTLRDGSQVSLLLLDLDHFKEFNDRYGHQVGDDCLRIVSSAILRIVRATDVVARYGGEEIAIILPSSDIAGALQSAEKVRVAIDALRLPHEDNLPGGRWLTASIGVATAVARDGGTMRMPESLLLAADNALYKAKNGGRNRIATALLVASRQG
jgi:diguanylate cyclase (GGDEF)-like protein/PAS domain S-box-containing protein